MVVNFDDHLVQLPSDHMNTDTVYVKAEKMKYVLSNKVEYLKDKDCNNAIINNSNIIVDCNK